MPDARQLISVAQAQAPLFAGVDLGGTNIKFGLVDDLGRTLAATSIPTQAASGPRAAIARMAAAVHQLAASIGLPAGSIARIGLGAPGPMDIPKGLLVAPCNLAGWWNFAIQAELAQAAGLPVTFANDANAAAYGEFWVGAGKDWKSLILYTLGTGVGGGVIVEEMLIEGRHSMGGELGHFTVDTSPAARECSCKRLGHVEAYASATAVVKRTEEALSAGRASWLTERISEAQPLTAFMVYQAAEAGDELAQEIIEETAKYLAIGVSAAMQAIDPDGVLLGGAMTFGRHESRTGREFIQRVREEVIARSMKETAQNTIVDYAALGGDAGYIGAAGLARKAHAAKP